MLLVNDGAPESERVDEIGDSLSMQIASDHDHVVGGVFELNFVEISRSPRNVQVEILSTLPGECNTHIGNIYGFDRETRLGEKNRVTSTAACKIERPALRVLTGETINPRGEQGRGVEPLRVAAFLVALIPTFAVRGAHGSKYSVANDDIVHGPPGTMRGAEIWISARQQDWDIAPATGSRARMICTPWPGSEAASTIRF